jgi:hypothetical protein
VTNIASRPLKMNHPRSIRAHYFFAHFLCFLAAWTLVIKYAFPIAYALKEGVALTTYVYWDLWWIAHLWLAWALVRQPPYTYWFALLVSMVEIVIIVTKFVIFLSAPEWTIWRTNWFINKIFVLACFVLLLGHLLLQRRVVTYR